MTRMTPSEAFVETLAAHGVTDIFGIMGSAFMDAMDIFEPAGIRFIPVCHEQGSAHMADGYARASGRPGICMSQIVGGVNLAAGLRDAWLSCTPLIAFSGGTTPKERYRNAYQEVEDISAFDPVTKFNACVDSVDRIPDLLRQAFRAATSGTPGPVHLRFAGNLGQIEEEELDAEILIEEQFT